MAFEEEGSSTLNPEASTATTWDIHPCNDTVPVSTVVQRYRDGLINTIGVSGIILKIQSNDVYISYFHVINLLPNAFWMLAYSPEVMGLVGWVWVYTIKVMLSQSVYLTTLFMGRLSPLKHLPEHLHILLPETDNYPSWISGRERLTKINIS